MGFTRSYYAKRAISKLFHKKTFYGSEPGVMARVECSRNAGIFVENKVSKLFSPLFLYFSSSSPSAPPPPQLCDVYLYFYLLFPFPWLTMEWAKKKRRRNKYRMIMRSAYRLRLLRRWPVTLCMRRAIARREIQGGMSMGSRPIREIISWLLWHFRAVARKHIGELLFYLLF